VDQDDFINIDSFETRVIRDTKSLNKFYKEINKTRKPGLPTPTVDFSRDMLVLVCLGEQKGKKNPVLSKLKETDEEISVAVEIVGNDENEEIKDSSTYFPFYLYKMPLVDKTVAFQKIEE